MSTNNNVKECQSRSAIKQVLGCFMQNPQLIAEYPLTTGDFVDSLDQLIFSSIFNLARTGAKVIDIPVVESYLEESYSSRFKLYNKLGGRRYLELAMELANDKNFLMNYEEVRKYSLLRDLMNSGISVNEFFDPDETDAEERENISDRFKSTKLTQLGEFYKNKVNDINNAYNFRATSTSIKAGGSAAKAQKELWKQKDNYGISYASNYLTCATDGIKKTHLTVMSAGTGVGKAIPDYTIIPTPIGDRKVGDIKPGDYLFGQDGHPTQVLAIHPQATDKEIWNVEFADGRVAECCKDHLWEVRYAGHNQQVSKVVSTEEIYNTCKARVCGFKGKGNRGYFYHIVKNAAVEYPEQQYQIDPYIFGLMLGDGSFREHPTNKSMQFSSKDEELCSAISSALGLVLKKNSKNNFSHYFQKEDGHNYTVSEFLCEYPDLINAYSYDKYIPTQYLMGSVEQRWALLQGLLDTDGHIDETKGNISLTTVSAQLKDTVVTLCRSLGLVATVSEDKRSTKYTSGKCYLIYLQTTLEEKRKCFRLTRKVEQVDRYLASHQKKVKTYPCHDIGIVNIYPTGKYTSMTCFTVDNKSHLFLMNDFVVTHNTRISIANIGHSFAPEFWDAKTQTWMKNPNGTQNKCLYIGTEMLLREEVEPILEAYIADVPEDHILHPDEYEEGEEERVDHAIDILEQGCIYMEYLPNYCAATLEEVIASHVFNHGVTHVFFDYIHTTVELLAEYKRESKQEGREDQVLASLSNKLKDWTRKYNVSIDTWTQVNGEFGNEALRDQRMVRSSKAIIDKADTAAVVFLPTAHDLAKIAEPLREVILKDKLVGMKLYKNRGSKHTNIIIWLDVEYGTMRVHDLFVTNADYSLYNDIDPVVVQVDEDTNTLTHYKSYSAMMAKLHGEESVLDEEDEDDIILDDDIDLNDIDLSEADFSGTMYTPEE